VCAQSRACALSAARRRACAAAAAPRQPRSVLQVPSAALRGSLQCSTDSGSARVSRAAATALAERPADPSTAAKGWDTAPSSSHAFVVLPSADSLAASGYVGSASAASAGGGRRSAAVSVDRSSARSTTAPLIGCHERCALLLLLLHCCCGNASSADARVSV
jgi:hypothetical protein